MEYVLEVKKYKTLCDPIVLGLKHELLQGHWDLGHWTHQPSGVAIDRAVKIWALGLDQ